ncbi:hypothetical protein E2C01_031855 [Portunus trituberculatus]|uniref:Uncharacterized protein n=1 Tax=Portunus trituberculatus TaxID=210409 RepID=A0A5B7EZA1_PORTR|nr:hypothetical protein [Portunus trituberculatus]
MPQYTPGAAATRQILHNEMIFFLADCEENSLILPRKTLLVCRVDGYLKLANTMWGSTGAQRGKTSHTVVEGGVTVRRVWVFIPKYYTKKTVFVANYSVVITSGRLTRKDKDKCEE